jgi:hypothetical protein
MSLPTPKWKEKAVELNTVAGAKVDSWLDKLKNSTWTAVILGVGGAVLIVFAMLAIIF